MILKSHISVKLLYEHYLTKRKGSPCSLSMFYRLINKYTLEDIIWINPKRVSKISRQERTRKYREDNKEKLKAYQYQYRQQQKILLQKEKDLKATKYYQRMLRWEMKARNIREEKIFTSDDMIEIYKTQIIPVKLKYKESIE